MLERRPLSPLRLHEVRGRSITDSLRQLEGAPWDVCGPQELAAALQVSPQALNDWRYLGSEGAPPPEDRRLYRGRAIVYRKDRLVAWAQAAGREQPPAHLLWEQGADYLQSELGMPRPVDRRRTDEMIVWLQEHGILRPRIWPTVRPYAPYSTRPNALHYQSDRDDDDACVASSPQGLRKNAPRP